jgi:hypothetical protein
VPGGIEPARRSNYSDLVWVDVQAWGAPSAVRDRVRITDSPSDKDLATSLGPQQCVELGGARDRFTSTLRCFHKDLWPSTYAAQWGLRPRLPARPPIVRSDALVRERRQGGRSRCRCSRPGVISDHFPFRCESPKSGWHFQNAELACAMSEAGPRLSRVHPEGTRDRPDDSPATD